MIIIRRESRERERMNERMKEKIMIIIRRESRERKNEGENNDNNKERIQRKRKSGQ